MARRALKMNEEVTSSWEIDEIIEGPTMKKFNGRMRRCYKVKWSESYEVESNIPAAIIEDFRAKKPRVVKVLGPVIDCDENKPAARDSSPESVENRKPTLTEMPEFKPEKSRFAVEIDGRVKLISYSDVRSKFKNELLTYYEERAKVFSTTE